MHLHAISSSLGIRLHVSCTGRACRRTAGRQSARQAAQERTCSRGPARDDRRHDRQARYRGDVEFLFEKTISADGFPAPLKRKSLEALAEAAANRNLRPTKDPARLTALIHAAPGRSDLAIETAAVRLAGLWKLEAAAPAIKGLAASPAADDSLRGEALDALAAIGGRAGRDQIEALTAPAVPAGIRIQAVAALAKLDVPAAAARAAELLAAAPTPDRELTPLLAAFLNRQGGADVLAAAIDRHVPPADSAKLRTAGRLRTRPC